MNWFPAGSGISLFVDVQKDYRTYLISCVVGIGGSFFVEVVADA
jgi:hypothetical protein